MVSSLQEISMRRDRQEVGMSKNRKLSLELKQISFGGAIELTLLGRGVAAITLGDVAGNGERGTNDCIGGGLRFAARAVLHDAQYFAAKGDGLLPDFEIPETSGHARMIGAKAPATGIKRMRMVSKRRPMTS